MKKLFLLISIVLFVILSCNKNDEVQHKPIAFFTVTPGDGDIRTEFLFDASASTMSGIGNTEIQVRWDYDNDGVWDVEWTTGKTTIHKYIIAGAYTAVLEVRNSSELTDRATKNINVINAPNDPPNPPSDPVPNNNANNQPVNITMGWVCTDPDQDVLVYDIYFGPSTNPPIVETGYVKNTFTPGQLAVKTTYYWKIVASDNFGGVTEGPLWQFTTADNIPACPTSFVDIRDGSTYLAVSIGSQCWMAENLKYKTGNNWCYNDVIANCDTYGRLYEWFSALTACPTGWHMPTDAEWKLLEGNVDSQFGVGNPVWNELDTWRGFDAGKNLKAIDGWFTGGNGTNNYGFNVKPGGARTQAGDFENVESFAYFWTKDFDSGGAYGRVFGYDTDKIKREKVSNIRGYSLRCLKN